MKTIDKLFKDWLDKNYLIEVKLPRKPFQEFGNQDDTLCKKAFEGGFNSAQALLSQGEPVGHVNKLPNGTISVGFSPSIAEKLNNNDLLYLAPPSNEALHKANAELFGKVEQLELDKADLIEYSRKILKTISSYSVDGVDNALLIPQPKCMENE